jgi:hypothetical protein
MLAELPVETDWLATHIGNFAVRVIDVDVTAL